MLPKVSALSGHLAQYEPVAWEMLPDFGLYMDQVILFIDKQLSPLRMQGKKHVVTSSMVNNYVKSGLVPRPQGKKYGREHLAILLMICSAKLALPMDQVAQLIDPMRQDIRALYEVFCQLEKQAFCRVSEDLKKIEDDAQAHQIALEMAVWAGANCYAATALLADGEDGDEQAEETVKQ